MKEYGQEENQVRLTFGAPVVKDPGNQQTPFLSREAWPIQSSSLPHLWLLWVLVFPSVSASFLTASALSLSWTGFRNKLGPVLCVIQASVSASLACSPKSDVRKAHCFSGNILGNEMALSELLPGTVKGSYCSSYSCHEFNDSLSGKENEFSVGRKKNALVLGRQRQTELGKFKASLVYIGSEFFAVVIVILFLFTLHPNHSPPYIGNFKPAKAI